MSDYRYSNSGEDVGLGSLTVLSPQPTADFVQATRRTFGLDGTVYDEGLFVIWRWTAIPNETTYQSILSTLGIQAATTNRGTLYTRSEDGSYVRYNGTAVRPQPGQDFRWERYFARSIEVVIHTLETAA